MVESRLVVPSVDRASALPAAASAVARTKDIEPVLTRNVFCSTCPPIMRGPETAEQPRINPEPQRTTLPIALLAIMYSPPPRGIKWSIAVVRDTEADSTIPVSVGGNVRHAVVTEIEETRLYLDNYGQTEFVDLLDPPPEPTLAEASAAAVEGSMSQGEGDALSVALDRGIKQKGANNFEIQRSTLEAVLGNMNLLSRSARIVPEVSQGKASGFRLYSVRPDGPFAKIGMQNGDLISSINGLEITSPEKALEVYAKLKSASHISVGLKRSENKVTQEYSIR
jgi:general secretion pathway protein C